MWSQSSFVLRPTDKIYSERLAYLMPLGEIYNFSD